MAGDDITHDDDPFAIFLEPPGDETSSERAIRETREAEAKKRSEAIDEELRTERQTRIRTSRGLLKAVLIGDSRSGKSRMINQLRMRYAPDDWDADLIKWSSVVRLKILKAVVTILDALQSELDGEAAPDSPNDAHRNGATEHPSDQQSSPGLTPLCDLDLGSVPDAPAGQGSTIQGKYQLVLLRLSPIRRIEGNLRKWLDTSIETHSTCPPGKEDEEVMSLIAHCREDIKFLSKDEAVKSILRKRDIQLEGSAEIFLEDLDRIASRSYTPSEEDIARVCSSTGIQEYRIKFWQTGVLRGVPNGAPSEQHMCLYDIGSSRMARQAWVPYFEGVDAVMVFVSLSGFDERLPEDPKVNRLEDSVLLWRTICASFRLLKPSGFILFLTGCDVLRRKLKQGVQVKDTVPSYGDRPSSPDVVVKYFRELFRVIAKQSLGEKSSLHIYPVSTMGVGTTAVVISAVKDIVLRENLKNGDFV